MLRNINLFDKRKKIRQIYKPGSVFRKTGTFIIYLAPISQPGSISLPSGIRRAAFLKPVQDKFNPRFTWPFNA